MFLVAEPVGRGWAYEVPVDEIQGVPPTQLERLMEQAAAAAADRLDQELEDS